MSAFLLSVKMYEEPEEIEAVERAEQFRKELDRKRREEAELRAVSFDSFDFNKLIKSII